MRFSAVTAVCLAAALTLAAGRSAAQTNDPQPGPAPGASPGGDTRREPDPGKAPTSPDKGAAPESAPASPPGADADAGAAAGPATGAAAGAEPEAAPTTGVPATIPPPPPGGESPKRAVPDFDGRGDKPTTGGEVALWIPRILFSPLYFISEYVIRRPLGLLITTAEQKQWPAAIVNFFTFGPDKKAGIFPTVFLDLGFRASIGFYAFWDDLLGKGNHLRWHFSTYGPDWVQTDIADRIPIGKEAFFDFHLEGTHRPDFVYHGIGPRTLQSDRMRFGVDKLQVRPVFETMWWRGSRITIQGGARYVNFRDDACCGNPSLQTRIDDGTTVAPPGYSAGGYTAAFERGEFTVDTREARPNNQTGARLELEVEHATNVRDARSSWVRYGGSVGGFVDIHNNRTVSLELTTLFVDPLSDHATIPFTEQIVLGGSGPMRGYLYGRLVDRSAAIATVKYRWPIWVLLDGTIQAALGNVFGPQLEDFKPNLLRMTANVGVESIGTPDNTFEILVGLGTETIEHGFNVNTARFLFGTNRGF